jgi:2-methylcitrate dehydratase PrpD
MIHDIVARLEPVGFDTLSKPAQDKLLLCVLANATVAVAGTSITTLPKPPVSPGGGGGPHVLFDGRRTADAGAAAFYNAAAMHARTQDDFHPIGNLHLATVILPAAMAAAGGRAVPGRTLLDALAVGYAAATGLSRQFSPRTTPRGLRSTCLYTPFGATAAVARVLGFSAAQTANALALTASMVGGTTQCWLDGSDEYQLHTGLAASNALLACELTQAGVVGGAHALDGRAGLFAAVVGWVPAFDEIAADFDADAAIVDTVLKRYPVSGICQPVVLASERLRARLNAGDVRSFALRMRAFELDYPGTANAGPFTSFSNRLMSARYCAASVLAHGAFDFDAFLGPVSPAVQALVDGADVTGDEALPPLSCVLSVDGTGGRRWTEEVIDGGAQLAITSATVDDWARPMWRAAGRGDAQYAAFREAVQALPKAADCRRLLEAL